jgi:flagellar biosynthesis GTPase FlhF
MKVVTFIADTPAAALARIQEQLGPEAVVLSVRPLPANGLSRLWQRSRAVEVLAAVDDMSQEPGARSQEPADGIQYPVSGVWHPASPSPATHNTQNGPHIFLGPPGVGKTTLLCKWLVSAVLTEQRAVRVWRLDGAAANTAEVLSVYAEMFGLNVERFWQESPTPPPSQIEHWTRSETERGCLSRSGPETTSAPELLENNRNVPPSAVEPAAPRENDLLLVDLPGTDTTDAQALQALSAQLATLPQARLHLVLNAAYETSILFEQFRAFARFPLEDVSFTHLDEEPRRGKLSDFLSGTNCSLGFLSTGQKIPGEFFAAHSQPPSSCKICQ